MRGIHSILRAFKARTAAVVFATVFCVLLLSATLLAQQSGSPWLALHRAYRVAGCPSRPSMRVSQPAPSNSPAPAATSSGQSSSAISSAPPAIPVDQIITQFAAREAEFRDGAQ